jgi:type III secretion protein C
MRLLLNMLTAAALVSTTLVAPTVQAADWSDKKFVYKAEGKKLSEVFEDFGASREVPVVVDPAVQGTVNGTFNSSSDKFLSAMSKTYGVVWYFDGVTLFIYPARAMQSKVFRLRGFGKAEVRDMLNSFGYGDKRFPLRFNEGERTVFAYGPPRHIELVAAAVETLEQGFKERGQNSVRVIPLKYAVAGDRVIGGTRVMGLANTLSRVFGGGQAASNADQAIENAEDQAKGMVSSIEKRGTAMERNYGAKPGSSSRDMGGPEGAIKNRGRSNANQTEGDIGIKKPVFQADEATNAIIINGPPERMADFEAVVRQLDVAQDMVEIEATIIDISSDEFESLGIDWDLTNIGRSRYTLNGGTLPLSNPNITTLVADAGRVLLTRIRALEGRGKARIVSRPKVLGSANRAAMMSDKRVASVRVAGNLDANLFSLEAGNVLQVQPQIIAYGNQREVKLNLFIQDGSFEETGVDQIPIVKRTEINTEATMREGESLLVGGISSEADIKDRVGLPGISRVPVIGALFRNSEGTKRSSQRMFLITPKIVNVRGTRARAGEPGVNDPQQPASGAAPGLSLGPEPSPTPQSPSNRLRR